MMIEKLVGAGIDLREIVSRGLEHIYLMGGSYTTRCQVLWDKLPMMITIQVYDPFVGAQYTALSLFGQDEKKVVNEFTRILGGSPFCRYQHRKINQAAATLGWKMTATYEWERGCPKERLEQILSDKSFYQVCIIR